MEVVALGEQPHQPQPPLPIPMMVKQYSIQVPFDPSSLDTAMLRTMLIPLKSTIKEINEYIQMIERAIRDRK